MAQATLLLILSSTFLQPLKSFLAATPRASTDRLDMGSWAGRRWDCLAGNSRLEHAERLKGPLGRTIERRWRHHRFFPLDLGLSSPAFSSRLAANGEGGGPVRDKQRKRKRGPKEHVPLGQQVGEDDGKEPWDFYTAPTPTSSLPSPKYEERLKFGRIMEDVLAAEKEEELPGLLTKHVEFLLSVDVTRLTNDLISLEPTLDRVQTLRNAYDFIITFLEGVVESTADLQKKNRELLREIIEVAKVGPVQFERTMEKLQDRFTYEFVKYLDAEVDRLEKIEGGKDGRAGGGRELLNVIKIVRSRVCAQMDLMMGEDVAILTRMLSYEDRYMMKAALRAVFREKSPEAIKAFGRLVSKTLEDINERGTEVDSLLKYKLADMADDTAALARAAQERREQKAATEDTGA